MKALSVRQPYASLIRDGLKSLEIRSRRTHHRGPLLICASCRPVVKDLPAGCALCMVDVVDSRPMTPDDATAACVEFRPGHYAWVLANVRLIDPFPVSGRLGLFDVIFQVPATTRLTDNTQAMLFG